MTPKEIERTKKKIGDIKRGLAAEKRKFGGYDDSRGLRYLPTRYFIQIGDYSGGLRYLRWFDKNFPNDGGFPEFLFESTIILFQTGHTKAAEKKAFQTFCSNPYWFDRYFGRPITPLDIWHSSNVTEPDYTENLEYSSQQQTRADFTEWLDKFISTEDFISRSSRYIDIYKKLKTETDKEMRRYLVRQSFQLEQGE